MNFEQQLKIQSYLDGELSPSEQQEVERWLAQDEKVQLFCDELRQVCSLLEENEPATAVPDSREFYWTGIERAIRPGEERVRQPAAEEPKPGILAWAQSWWVRLALPAAAIVLLIVAVQFNAPSEPPPAQTASQDVPSNDVGDTEVPTDDVNTFAFHSEAAGMTVVWVETLGQ